MNYRVIILILLAFTLRISFLIVAPARPLTWDDTISWDSVAWNLLNKRGFTEIDGTPTHVRPPVYPIFLALVYKFFGRNYTIVHLIQTIISSLIIVLIYLLSNKFFNDIRIAFFSAMICAIWPAFIVYTGIIGTETLYSFIFILFLYFLYIAHTKLDIKYYILSGIVLGITNLTRSTIVFYPLFLIVIEYLIKKDVKKIKNILLMFVLSMLIVLPWTIRNYKVFGRFLLINTSAGELFWAGTYGPWDGYIKHNRDEYFHSLFNLRNPVDNERKMFREGVKNIINNPGIFLKLTIKKFFRLWFKPVGQELVEKKYKILGKVMYLVQTIIFVTFLYGFIKAYSEKMIPILAMFIYFAVMHNLITPLPRYRIPIEWVMLIFSSYGVLEIYRRCALGGDS